MKTRQFLWEYLGLALVCSWVVVNLFAQPPMPPLPKTMTKAQSPKDASNPDNANKAMVITSATVVQTNVGTVLTLAATYETNETVLNLTAFCQVSTNLTKSWQTIASMPYTNKIGGLFAVPYTNMSPTLFFRFGYSFPL